MDGNTPGYIRELTYIVYLCDTFQAQARLRVLTHVIRSCRLLIVVKSKARPKQYMNIYKTNKKYKKRPSRKNLNNSADNMTRRKMCQVLLCAMRMAKLNMWGLACVRKLSAAPYWESGYMWPVVRQTIQLYTRVHCRRMTSTHT